MSVPLLIISLIFLISIPVLTLRIGNFYHLRLSAGHLQEKDRLHFFQDSIRNMGKGSENPAGVYCLLLYLALHVVVPLIGLGLFLKNDWNFLVVIVSIIWSMQLLQRVYPGPPPEEEGD